MNLHDDPSVGLRLDAMTQETVLAPRAPRDAGNARPAPAPEAPPERTPAPVLRGPAPPLPPDRRFTAADFSEAAVLGHRRGGEGSGWRHAVSVLTRGVVTLPPSVAETRRRQLLARVTAPIDGTRRVVVMSRKGGVGKTTVSVGIGATFASLRGDRVVAVDANPDAGNLARRIGGDCQRTITDLLADGPRVKSFATMRGYTSQDAESRLEVIASDDDASIAEALDQRAYAEVVSLLDHYYNLLVLDTGTGILDSANQGLLTLADQLVLVVPPALDGARAGAQTLDWLDEHGHADLVAGAVVAVNGIDRETDPIVDYCIKHFSQRCTSVVTIPWDAALAEGAHTKLSRLSRRTRRSFTALAAALADNFDRAPRGMRGRPTTDPTLPEGAHLHAPPAPDMQGRTPGPILRDPPKPTRPAGPPHAYGTAHADEPRSHPAETPLKFQ